MSKKIIFLVLMMMVSVVWAAEIKSSDSILIENDYVRMVPPGADATAAFMTLKNTGKKDVTLIQAQASISDEVELHMHIQENGQFKMVQVEKFTIAAGQVYELKPGGSHIMLMNLKKNLRQDQEVKMTLIFADKSKREFLSRVRPMTARVQ